jgi:putative hydrolase of the HAD superfamily
MLNLERIDWLAFDADDTLWENETTYREAEQWFAWLMADYISEKDLLAQMLEVEIRNISVWGYGTKSFVLSMIEVAERVMGTDIDGKTVMAIVHKGKEMLRKPVRLIDGVLKSLEILCAKFRTMVITKGDNFDQMRKLRESGLMDLFDQVHVVVEKDEKNYREVFRHAGTTADRVLMVGNSLRSDIVPMLRMGAQGVYIPFHTTWSHEMVAEEDLHGLDFLELKHLADLPTFLQ